VSGSRQSACHARRPRRLPLEDPRAEVVEEDRVGVGVRVRVGPVECKLNVVLTPRVHSSVKFVGLPLATRATVE